MAGEVIGVNSMAARNGTIGFAIPVNLVKGLLPQLAEKGYCNAYAGITLPNAASVALHESVGFEQIGVYHRVGYKLGSWHDVGWWERPLGEYSAAPSTPKLLLDVMADPRWQALLEASRLA